MRILMEIGAGVAHLAYAAAPLCEPGSATSGDPAGPVAFAVTLLISIPAADFVARWMLGEGRLDESLAGDA